jgi:hypothetical protein
MHLIMVKHLLLHDEWVASYAADVAEQRRSGERGMSLKRLGFVARQHCLLFANARVFSSF